MTNQDHGRHTITGAGTSGPPLEPVFKPEPPPEPERGYGGFVLFVLVFGFLAMLKDGSGPSLPPAPARPAAKVAVFTALGSAGDAKVGAVTREIGPLQVKLAGGSYELSYSTAQTAEAALAELGTARRIFFANFTTGESWGELQDADTILMVGRVFLHIAEIGKQDVLRSAVTLYGNSTSAYFNYAQSPRGPPPATGSAKYAKRIVVLGEILGLEFGSATDRSVREVRVLDLEPSAAEMDRYEAAKVRYAADVARIERISQEGAARNRALHR